jgi:DnaJ homolog subfamily A member 5
MGAQQSSNREDSSAEAAAVAKTCYYELLGVERLASDDE